MKKVIKKLWRDFKALALGPFWFLRDLVRYRAALGQSHHRFPLYIFPEIFDKNPASHTFDKHYVYMDLWAFKLLLAKKPAEHVDVGSSIRFLSMASAAAKLKFVDIRPVKLDLDNFECVEGSILSMPFSADSVDSLSCLHVAEHIGLGRYGDPLDPNGTEKACKELARVLKPGGRLYFAVPVGRPATYFNSHRVHNPKLILEYFNTLKLVSFAAINDSGHFIKDAKPEDYEHSLYACGCYEFTKN